MDNFLEFLNSNSAFNDMFWQIISYVVGILFTIATAFVTAWVKKMYDRIKVELDDKTEEKINNIIKSGVNIAEQFKINGWVVSGKEAKEKAVSFVQKELDSRNIKVDASSLYDKIENAYFDVKTNDWQWSRLDVADVLKKAVEVSIAAYKNSGTDEEAKEYAKRVSEKILNQFGIKVDTEILEAFIIGEIQKLLEE